MGSLLIGELAAALQAETVVVLHAYCDESGTHRESKATIIAGFLGPTDEWTAIEADWTAVIRREGISRLHATECEAARGEFRL